MGMQRATAQQLTVLVLDAEGLPVTDDAANLSAKVSKDGGAYTALADTSATHTTDGLYTFDLTTTETDAGSLRFAAATSTADLAAVIAEGQQGVTITPVATPADVQALARKLTSGSGLAVGLSGATGIDAVLGRFPIAGSATYETECNQWADVLLALCPAERATTYYFAADGDDANDGLSITAPKQTLAAANALLGAGVACLFKRGDVWRGNTSLVTNSGSVGAYGIGTRPRFTGARLLIAASSAAWTLAAGNRYTATLANAASLHPQSWAVDDELTIASSQANCEATSDSYWIDGSTVHVNLGGTDPNTLAWEANHTADYGNDREGVRLTGDGSRVEGVACDRNAYGAFASGENQSYGITAKTTGEQTAVVRDCACHIHVLHNVGHLASSGGGGRTLFEDITFGGCRQEGATLFVDYTATGGQHCLMRRGVVSRGLVPRSSITDPANVRACFGHSTGGNTTGFVAFHDIELLDSPNPCPNLGIANDSPGSFDDLASLRTIYLRCPVRDEMTIGGDLIPLGTNNVYVACDVTLRPAWDSSLGIVNFGMSGWALACQITIDWTDVAAAGPNDRYGWFTSNTWSNGRFYNCHIRQINAAPGMTLALARRWNDDTPQDVYGESVNTIWETDKSAGVHYIGFANEGAVANGAALENNAVYGHDDRANGERGYSFWTDTIELDSPPSVADQRLIGQGSPTGALCEVDGHGRPLAKPGDSIGPWGPLAESVQTSRLALTNAQATELTAASNTLTATQTLATVEDALGDTEGQLAVLTDRLSAPRAAKLDSLLDSGTVAAAGATATNLDQVSGGGGGTVNPRVIIGARVWSYDKLRSSATAIDLVEIAAGPIGWLAFEPALNPGTAVRTVTAVTIVDSEGEDVTGSLVSNLGPSADYEQCVFQVGTLPAGTYTVTCEHTRTDGAASPLIGTLRLV